MTIDDKSLMDHILEREEATTRARTLGRFTPFIAGRAEAANLRELAKEAQATGAQQPQQAPPPEAPIQAVPINAADPTGAAATGAASALTNLLGRTPLLGAGAPATQGPQGAQVGPTQGGPTGQAAPGPQPPIQGGFGPVRTEEEVQKFPNVPSIQIPLEILARIRDKPGIAREIEVSERALTPTEKIAVFNSVVEPEAKAITQIMLGQESGDTDEDALEKHLADLVERRGPRVARAAANRGRVEAITQLGVKRAERAKKIFDTRVQEAKEKRARGERAAKPSAQVRELEAQILMDIAEGKKFAPDSPERKFLDERARLNPLTRVIRDSLEPAASQGIPTQEDINQMFNQLTNQRGREPTEAELKAFMLGQGFEF